MFDAIVDLLIKQGGRARKGNGRNHKLGESGCEENTVVGTVALCRDHDRKIGDSVFDPVFVLACSFGMGWNCYKWTRRIDSHRSV